MFIHPGYRIKSSSIRRFLTTAPKARLSGEPYRRPPTPKLPHILSERQPHRRETVVHIQGSITTATGFLFVAFVTYLSYITLSGSEELDSPKLLSSPKANKLLAFSVKHTIESSKEMADLIPPGRPGNLTLEQEAKLREFWQATLKVFGVLHSQNGVEVNGNMIPNAGDGENAQKQRTDTIESERLDKKKKKRISFFSRKQKDTESDKPETISTPSVAPIPETYTIPEIEDKYGLTKGFRHALASQSPEDLRSAFWSMVKHDHPDALLLRFLRARKWDVEKALVMLVSTMHWRSQEMHVDDEIMKEGEAGALEASVSTDANQKREGADFLTQLRMGKSFLHGTDKDGRPLCYVRVRLHKQGEQSEASLERFTVYVIETARLLLSSSVDTAAIVFDMTGFSMANMDYGPVKFMIKCFEANYPESLGVVLVHKSPWIFQGIWTIIKGWLDPVVASKVHFTKNVAELEQYIPRERIIKELGGDDEWTYDYLEPVADENKNLSNHDKRQEILLAREAIVAEYEKATKAWIAASTETQQIQESTHKRNEIADQLKRNYWLLDPYCRARSLYDRSGLILPDGYLEFYPRKPVEADKVESVVPFHTETSPDDLD
ncbi:MAG: hypothetical protein M1829_004824 [Trizodia sp. TS-e1964]|nr:MAG: hypothetical protein M1829_004824 [Trizodia sp. TS-e1964]